MKGKKYKVFINNKVVAEEMDIETATILVKALFEEYYNEYPLKIGIEEMGRYVECESVSR